MRSAGLRAVTAAATGLLLGAAVAGAQAAPDRLDVGASAPALAVEDVDGEPLDWQRFGERAVVLYFHSHAARFATRGLEEVVAALQDDDELHERVALVVVTDGEEGVGDVRRALDGTKVGHAIAVDPDRRGAAPYRVIAVPTVFTIDGGRKIAHVARGYGQPMPARVRAAARFAAGLIDREAFEEALRPGQPKRGEERVRVANLVERLLARGSHASARKMLEKAMASAPEDPRLLELAARVALGLGDGDAAEAHMAHLERVGGRTPATRELRAELLLLRDDAAAALAELDGLPLLGLRSALLKGRVLERLGRFEEAAKVYRRALERQLRDGTGR